MRHVTSVRMTEAAMEDALAFLLEDPEVQCAFIASAEDALRRRNDSESVDELADMVAIDEAGTRTFSSAGLLTGNKGLVIKLTDGTEFQLTIVQSR